MTARNDFTTSWILLIVLWIGIVAGASNYAGLSSRGQPAATSQSSTLPSWNPAVSCNAVLLTETQFVGNVPNPTQPFPGAPYNATGADYSGGGLRLAGNLPAGSNPNSEGGVWPYSKRSLSPPCQVTLSNGTAVPTFVEIHNVVVGEVHNDECGSLYPGQCDKTFNVCDYTNSQCLQQDQSLTGNYYPTTMFQHHNEIDMAWNNSGLIPASQEQIQTGMKVDLQGFVYWDNSHLNISYHSFSGWELHPLTAWRLTASPSVVVTSSPTPAVVGLAITFTGNIVGGTSPYDGISWTFGDGGTSSCQTGSGQSCTVQHTYNVPGNYSLTASTSNSKGNTGTETLTIQVLPFSTSFSWAPTNPSVGQVVSLNATASGGSQPYSFNWDFGDGDTATGPTVSHVYVQAQFFKVKLSATDISGNTGVRQSSIAVGSWNPKVNCSPVTVRVTDITNNMTGSASLSNSLFNPGITSPVGNAKRWLTPGSTPFGWVSPGPPCTVTNSHGTVGIFVEIDGVKRASISTEDCVTSYDKVNGGTSNGGTCAGGSGTNCGSYCDSTFNIYDPSIVPTYSGSCTSATDPTCYGRIHIEIDHDWKAAHYCGAATTCDNSTLATQTSSSSTLLDVQGFVYWDPGNLNQQWHSFNGWEIHPMSAWRIHRTALTVSISASSTNPALGQGDTLTAAVSGGTGPYTYTWDFGDGTTTTGTASQVVHIYGSAGTHIVHLYAVDSFGASGTSSKTITVVSTLAVSFTHTTPVAAGSPVTFNATATGGLAPYTFNWNFGDNATAVGQTSTHTYRLGATYTVKLTGTDSNSATGTNTQSLTVTSPQPLVANFTYTQPVVTGQASTFTSTTTGGMSPYSFAWNFGDEGTVTGNPATHQYSAQGSYVVRLTVQDSAGHNSTASRTVSVSQSDFGISANPMSITILAGTFSTSTITLASLNSFSGTVAFSGSSSAPGLSLSFSPANASLSAGGTSTSTLSISSNTVGSYNVTVKGTSGSLFHNVYLTVIVADFAVNASPASVTVNAGVAGTSTITVSSVNGFSGNITLAATVSPTGLTCSLSPAGIALGASQNSTLSCSGPAGQYAVTVTGTSGSTARNTTVSYAVQDFSLTANPISATLNAGATATSTITITPLAGFNGTVSLGYSASSTGITCSLTTSSVVLGPTQTSTLSCAGTAGTYTVTVTGTSSSLSHSATVTLTVQDFTFTASPTTVNLNVGTTEKSTVSVFAVNGFAQAMTLSASVPPSSGLACTLSPSSLTGSSNSTLFCFPSTSGTFTVNVTGVGGPLSHSTTVTFVVVVPAPSPYAAMGTYDGRVYKYYANGTNVFIGKPVGSALRQVAWKPDGSYALIVGDQGVILTYDGNQLVRISSTVVGTTNLNTVAWRPDGSYALLAGANGLIFKYNTTAITKIADPVKNNLRSISWNPQGNSALLVGDKGTALLYQTSGQITVLASGTGQNLFAVAWNPDGSYALAGGQNGIILKYVTSFKALNVTGITPAGKNVRFISFNPTGSLALLVGDSGLVVTWDGTKLASQTSGTNNNLYSVSWSASTAYIAGQNGTLISYTGGALTKLPSGTTANIGSVTWKPT